MALNYGNASVAGDATITDRAHIHGHAEVLGKVVIGGTAELDRDSKVCRKEDFVHMLAPGVLWSLTMTQDNIVCGCLSKTYAEWDAAANSEDPHAAFAEWKVDAKYFLTCEVLIRALRAYLRAHGSIQD